VQLQTHSPINGEDQRLNLSGKIEAFQVKFVVDFYFFDFAEYECDKTIALFLTSFEKIPKLIFNNEVLYCF
jgi:hypothetical protein